jgi:methyl-accepting chemotaxis protein
MTYPHWQRSSALKWLNSEYERTGNWKIDLDQLVTGIIVWEPRNYMFRQLKLSGKIVGIIVLVLAITSLISFWVTQHRINQQAEEAFRDKVRQITGMASTTQVWFSNNLDTLVPDRNFRDLNQVPVVAAWRVAEMYADKNDMKFRTPSLTPRNPKNQPDDFERRALEMFQKDPAMKEFSERESTNGKEVMRYAQPVRLTQDCLVCHGSPLGQMGPFGYAKEGMKVGELRGAFSVTASTESLISTANSNSIAVFSLSLLTLLLSAGTIFLAIRKLVIRPLKKSVEFANRIANGDLSASDLTVESEDEIGESTVALNTMKTSLRRLLGGIADGVQTLASSATELTAISKETAAGTANMSEGANAVAVAAEEASSNTTSIAAGMDQSSRNLSSVASATEEMSATVGDIAANTSRARTISEQATSQAHAISSQMQKLGQAAQEIGNVTETITNISAQTNLLALNATIEAARAGAAGKGFAVVANEIKELARQTAEATEDIKMRIAGIQDSAGMAIGDIGQITTVIRDVGGIVASIAAAIEEQATVTKDVAGNIAQASAGVQEADERISQTAEVSRSIARDIARVNAKITGIREGGAQVQASAVELSNLAEQLGAQLAQFRM